MKAGKVSLEVYQGPKDLEVVIHAYPYWRL